MWRNKMKRSHQIDDQRSLKLMCKTDVIAPTNTPLFENFSRIRLEKTANIPEHDANNVTDE